MENIKRFTVNDSILEFEYREFKRLGGRLEIFLLISSTYSKLKLIWQLVIKGSYNKLNILSLKSESELCKLIDIFKYFLKKKFANHRPTNIVTIWNWENAGNVYECDYHILCECGDPYHNVFEICADVGKVLWNVEIGIIELTTKFSLSKRFRLLKKILKSKSDIDIGLSIIYFNEITIRRIIQILEIIRMKYIQANSDIRKK